MPDYIRLCCSMHSTALFKQQKKRLRLLASIQWETQCYTELPRTALPCLSIHAFNRRPALGLRTTEWYTWVVWVISMTSMFETLFWWSAYQQQQHTCNTPKEHMRCTTLCMCCVSELAMPITGSIEADRHMGLTNRDEGQQYVTHPSRNQSRLWREPCVHVGFCCILSRNQLIQL